MVVMMLMTGVVEVQLLFMKTMTMMTTMVRMEAA